MPDTFLTVVEKPQKLSIPMHVSIPKKMHELLKARGKKSKVAQKAIEAYLNQSPQVNEITSLAIQCDEEGHDLTAIANMMKMLLP